ncbi:MAG: dipeptidase, partial [Candidatus Bathyarchaeota archaeon]|nr:dipeptidase [Candidatus Bathyarchaeota archaeon]
MAKRIPVVDLHEDVAYHYVTGGNGVSKPLPFDMDIEGRDGDIPKYMRGYVKLVFSSIFPLMPTFNPKLASKVWSGYRGVESICVNTVRDVKLNVIEQIKVYGRMARCYPQIKLIGTRRDLDDLFNSDAIGFLVSLEGTDAIDDLDDLELFYRLGVRSIQLTWNYDCRVAASCMSRRDYGLTGFGEEVIEEANRLGIIIDLAHASERTCIEAIEASKLPVIVSHANIAKVKPHPRNLTDNVLELLASKKGVVGFTFIPSTIADNPSIDHLVDHILYAYEHYGGDILSLGTDYFGLIYSRPPPGLEDISKVLNLWGKLVERGLPESA